jgi:ATP-binding cassette subfamily C protein
MSTLAGVRVLIPQEAYVFAGTLAENLTYLRPQARADDLSRAVQTLGAAALVHRIGGYQAQVCPGDLSAGERQLIALVRAYLSPARVAVLDEATCHLDPASEERVERAFANRGGTLVVIAHRISSAARARRVLVLDGHRAVLGDHATLVSRSGLYRDLAGYWAVRSESEPTGLPGDADRVDPGAGPQLHVYPGEVVAHGAGREE